MFIRPMMLRASVTAITSTVSWDSATAANGVTVTSGGSTATSTAGGTSGIKGLQGRPSSGDFTYEVKFKSGGPDGSWRAGLITAGELVTSTQNLNSTFITETYIYGGGGGTNVGINALVDGQAIRIRISNGTFYYYVDDTVYGPYSTPAFAGTVYPFAQFTASGRIIAVQDTKSIPSGSSRWV